MNETVETFLRLNAENDIDGMVRYTREGIGRPDVLVHAVYYLILTGKLRPAYVVAMLLANARIENPAISVALAVGGLTFGNAEEETRGRNLLRAQVDQSDAVPWAEFYREVLEPVFRRLLEAPLLAANQNQVLRILEILQEGVPNFRTMFDRQASAPPLTLDALRRRGQGSARLVDYPSPPAGIARPARRAVVAVRELFFPDMPWSRPLDLGPRLVAGMAAYGWQASFHGMKWSDQRVDYQGIVEFCRQQQAELLILDDNMIEATSIRPARAAMIALLRRELPSLKIVSILFDTWSIEPALLKECLADVDCIWETTSPSLSVWQDPVFAGRLLHMQVPHAGNACPPVPPLRPSFSFRGGVMGYNWHRAFWLAAADALGLPIDKTLSSHATDGLSALDSYTLYMQQLAQAPCSLNLSMRSDLSCIVTGRCFETIITGSLLVQEATPDMDYYFVSGEHYLSFSSLAELKAVIDFIDKNRDEADAIRHRGNAFARERYSDDKIIGYLDKALFYPG